MPEMRRKAGPLEVSHRSRPVHRLVLRMHVRLPVAQGEGREGVAEIAGGKMTSTERKKDEELTELNNLKTIAFHLGEDKRELLEANIKLVGALNLIKETLNGAEVQDLLEIINTAIDKHNEILQERYPSDYWDRNCSADSHEDIEKIQEELRLLCQDRSKLISKKPTKLMLFPEMMKQAGWVRKQKPLTDEEMEIVYSGLYGCGTERENLIEMGRAVELAHGITNDPR